MRWRIDTRKGMASWLQVKRKSGFLHDRGRVMTQIFLCHANEDKPQVEEIYRRLKGSGYQPWMDKIDLLPGQLWEQVIPEVLKTSDFILIFFSKHSVTKRGYVQRELKLAITAWEEIPEGMIHTIPVRLDSCIIPERFRKFQWVDLFDELGFEKILQAIQKKNSYYNNPYTSPEVIIGKSDLEDFTVSTGQNVEIEITIDRDFDSYTKSAQEQFLRAVGEFLKMDTNLKITRKRRGSVKITISLPIDKAEELLWAIKSGQFEEYGAVEADISIPGWYAIQTRSRHEKVVRDQLAAKSITHLLPLWRKRSIWKDRVKFVDVPLFSGYLFGYFALQDKIAVLETVGVARLMGTNDKPMPIPEEQIAVLRTLTEHRLPCSPHPYLVEGMRVRIKSGLLAGAEGILIQKKQRHRLVINIDIIRQAVAVDIDLAGIESLDPQETGEQANEKMGQYSGQQRGGTGKWS
jgi:transcription antitermination factor NusG